MRSHAMRSRRRPRSATFSQCSSVSFLVLFPYFLPFTLLGILALIDIFILRCFPPLSSGSVYFVVRGMRISWAFFEVLLRWINTRILRTL